MAGHDTFDVTCVPILRIPSSTFRYTAVESTNTAKRKAIMKGVRNFRNFTYIATFLMYNLVFVVAIVYVPRLMLPAVRMRAHSLFAGDFCTHLISKISLL